MEAGIAAGLGGIDEDRPIPGLLLANELAPPTDAAVQLLEEDGPERGSGPLRTPQQPPPALRGGEEVGGVVDGEGEPVSESHHLDGFTRPAPNQPEDLGTETGDGFGRRQDGDGPLTARQGCDAHRIARRGDPGSQGQRRGDEGALALQAGDETELVDAR